MKPSVIRLYITLMSSLTLERRSLKCSLVSRFLVQMTPLCNDRVQALQIEKLRHTTDAMTCKMDEFQWRMQKNLRCNFSSLTLLLSTTIIKKILLFFVLAFAIFSTSFWFFRVVKLMQIGLENRQMNIFRTRNSHCYSSPCISWLRSANWMTNNCYSNKRIAYKWTDGKWQALACMTIPKHKRLVQVFFSVHKQI